MAENWLKTPLENLESWSIEKETHGEVVDEMTQKELDDKRKTAEQLEPFSFGIRTVKDAFDFLLKKWQAWENIVMSLNWKKVYSFGVKAEDDLYLQYYWKTKFEREKEVQQAKQEYEVKKEKEHLERLQTVSNLIEEWKKYIKTEYIEEWEQMINKIDVDDMYGQYDLLAIADALTIIKMIEKDSSYEDIQKWFDKQRRTEDHYGTIIKYVIHFSKDSKDFDKRIRKATKREV